MKEKLNMEALVENEMKELGVGSTEFLKRHEESMALIEDSKLAKGKDTYGEC